MSSRFRFEPLTESTIQIFAEWRARPHVAEQWGEPGSLDELRSEYLVPDRAEGATENFIVSHDGRQIGFAQVYTVMGSVDGWWPDETDPGARGIDLFLAHADDLNKGLGSAMIRALLAFIFAAPEVTTVQVDPHPDNPRAIRAYEKAGFVRERIVDTPDGLELLMRCTRESWAEAAVLFPVETNF